MTCDGEGGDRTFVWLSGRTDLRQLALFGADLVFYLGGTGSAPDMQRVVRKACEFVLAHFQTSAVILTK